MKLKNINFNIYYKKIIFWNQVKSVGCFFIIPLKNTVLSNKVEIRLLALDSIFKPNKQKNEWEKSYLEAHKQLYIFKLHYHKIHSLQMKKEKQLLLIRLNIIIFSNQQIHPLYLEPKLTKQGVLHTQWQGIRLIHLCPLHAQFTKQTSWSTYKHICHNSARLFLSLKWPCKRLPMSV